MHRQDKNAADKDQLSLILLPGTLCDERIFAPLLTRLPGLPARVIAHSHATSTRQAALHVLSHAPEHFALLGYSLGGMVSMEIAALAPERVRGLALLSTSPLPVPADRHAARRTTAERAATMPMETFVQSHLWPDYSQCADQTPADDPTLALMQSMASSLGHGTFHRQTEMALQRPDYRTTLGSVRCPSIVIAGDQDRLCPPEAQNLLHQGLPGSTLHLLQGAGHLALLERPDEVARAVAAWFHTVLQKQGSISAQTAARQESE